jgi:hypothetical protein
MNCFIYKNSNLVLPTITPGMYYSNVSTPQTIHTWQRVYDDPNTVLFSSNIIKYGALYNWHAATYNTGGASIAPAGWHVPTDVEYDTLVDTLGG